MRSSGWPTPLAMVTGNHSCFISGRLFSILGPLRCRFMMRLAQLVRWGSILSASRWKKASNGSWLPTDEDMLKPNTSSVSVTRKGLG